MLTRSLKLIHRFWLGLLTLVFMLTLLGWTVPPQPREKVVFWVPAVQVRQIVEETVYSRDHRYVAARYSLDYQSGAGNRSAFAVYDTITTEELFRISGVVRQISFGPSGTLLFRHQPNESSGTTMPVDEYLLRWDPARRSKHVVSEYHVPASLSSEVELRSSSLNKNDFSSTNWSLLSPDARTWIVPCHDEKTHWYELIEVASGKSRGRLALPEMLNGVSTVRVNEMRFSNDGEVLVVQTRTWSKNNNEQYRLHWLQSGTGKELGSMPIPTDIAMISYADSELVVAAEGWSSRQINNKHVVYVIKRRAQELNRIVLDEIQPELQERPKEMPPEYVNPNAQLECHVDPVSQTLITCWHYCFSEKVTWANRHSVGTNYLSDVHYSVRHLSTGEMLHSDCLKFPFKGNSLDALFGWGQVMVCLPGPILFVSHSRIGSDNQFQQWIEWLQQKLNIEQDIFKQRHVVVDGRSGKTLSSLNSPGNVHHVKLSQDQRTLTLITGSQEHFYYDYPLRQPWLLIWTWALGVAGGITLLVEARRWWRHHRQKLHG